MPCPRPYGYRNRLMIRTQWNKPKQCLNIGFLRGDSRFLYGTAEHLRLALEHRAQLAGAGQGPVG